MAGKSFINSSRRVDITTSYCQGSSSIRLERDIDKLSQTSQYRSNNSLAMVVCLLIIEFGQGSEGRISPFGSQDPPSLKVSSNLPN